MSSRESGSWYTQSDLRSVLISSGTAPQADHDHRHQFGKLSSNGGDVVAALYALPQFVLNKIGNAERVVHA
jgi:hypothetical protein